VAEFNLEGWQQGGWQSIAKGTTIGYKRILRFPETTTSKVRLTIQKARACPALSTFALYRAGQI
jgi:alpha-L-fucosidase